MKYDLLINDYHCFEINKNGTIENWLWLESSSIIFQNNAMIYDNLFTFPSAQFHSWKELWIQMMEQM